MAARKRRWYITRFEHTSRRGPPETRRASRNAPGQRAPGGRRPPYSGPPRTRTAPPAKRPRRAVAARGRARRMPIAKRSTRLARVQANSARGAVDVKAGSDCRGVRRARAAFPVHALARPLAPAGFCFAASLQREMVRRGVASIFTARRASCGCGIMRRGTGRPGRSGSAFRRCARRRAAGRDGFCRTYAGRYCTPGHVRTRATLRPLFRPYEKGTLMS